MWLTLIGKKAAAVVAGLALVAVFAASQAAAQNSDSENHFNLAVKMMDEDNLRGAVAEYRKAIEAAGGNYAEAHNNLGMALGMLGETHEAIREFMIAIKQRDDYAEAHYNLGIAFSMVEELAASEREFITAIRLKPGDFPEAHDNLGIIYARQAKLPLAITEFQIAIEQAEGNYPEAHYNLGIAYFKTGKLEAAVAEFKDSIAQNDGFPEAHYNLGTALSKLGQTDEAVREFETYLKLAVNPKDSEAVRTRINEMRKASLK